MTYADTRRIIDVDSHVIELEDFLDNAVDPRDRALIPPMSEQSELPVLEAGLARGRELFHKRQNDPEVMAKFEASMTNCDQKTMDAFYYGNMADWLGLPG